MTSRHITKNKQSGFTLVELAIVMIIIGLLIGGILKGQELVANAQTTATIAQIKGLDGALSTFRDKYSALPGDMRNPTARLRDCDVAPCSSGGDGRGSINEPAVLGNTAAVDSEGAVAFVHMAAADLISGVRIDEPELLFGVMLPEAKIGGGFWMGFTSDGTAAGGVTGMRSGHYLVLNAAPDQNVGGPNGGLTATQAAQIDRKLDDGDPDSGAVHSSTGNGCINGDGEYNESDDTSLCGMYIRVQG